MVHAVVHDVLTLAVVLWPAYKPTPKALSSKFSWKLSAYTRVYTVYVIVVVSCQWKSEVQSDAVGCPVRSANGQLNNPTCRPVTALLPVWCHGTASTGHKSCTVWPSHGCSVLADHWVTGRTAEVSYSVCMYIQALCGAGAPFSPLSIYFLIFSPLYFSLSFIGFTSFFLLSIPSLSTRIVPLRFQAGGRRRRLNLGLVCFVCVICIP